MKFVLVLFIATGSAVGLGGLWALRGSSGTGQTAGAVEKAVSARSSASLTFEVAANGVVEGARPEVAIQPEVAGLLASIPVSEDQEVTAGQLLAELSNETQKQNVALAAAEVETAKAQLDRLRNGERTEKRQAVAAVESAKKAVYEQAKRDWERSQKLAGNQAASREERDHDYFVMKRAEADVQEATAERALIEAPARVDEVAAAEGRVHAAEARLGLAQAELAKTRLLASCDGRVLQIFADPGEMAGPSSTQPVMLLADLSKRRIRAFIEELDADRVQVGQPAVVTADGFPNKSFAGRVAVVIPRMGRRALQTDTPGEYKDLYFREAMIDLEEGAELPLNLRVQARIKPAPAKRP
ncbi:MAG TPA: efflux RND transporter periplasmic adaptor subunit [Isosphaeraceae bacterium]|nr:efflux RND transporter periplasmic adaptor subunit [Isosphaeraceae bacterium]